METSIDGVVSGKTSVKPSSSSLIYFSTLVNGFHTHILLDSGATTTFINENILKHLSRLEYVNKNSFSFVLADGIASFHVLGTVKIFLLFANAVTTVHAHVARNLCTNLILGMDYINRYHLSFSVKHQTISIEYQNTLLTIKMNNPPTLLNQSTVSLKDTLMSSSIMATNPPGGTTDHQPVDMNRSDEVCEFPCSFLPSITHKLDMQNPNIVASCPEKKFSSSLSVAIQTLVDAIPNPQHHNRMHELLTRFSSTFDTSKHNIAKTSINHVINTIPHSPPACKPYPQPDKAADLYKLVQEFLDADLISESHSPYAAPAFLIKKNDATFRFVVDYKKLNLITIKDSYPLPNMEESLRTLGQGYRFFSKLDLKSGFYQIPIRDSDKEKTAFITPFGLYQFNVLPMGLKNSPPTFQKVMNDTLKNCRLFSNVYIDDVIVFSQSFDDHMLHLEAVLTALQQKQLVVNPPKCIFAVNQINYLGHTISYNTITPLKEKTDAILAIKEPRTLTQANKFLGALNWYRKFIPNFSTIAAPIHSVTNLTKANRHKFHWKYAQSKAFHALKQLLVSKPLFLHFPVDNVPLILTTDASNVGIGGVLQQEIDGQLYNLYYHSQLMTPCEKKYSAIEKEALAIYKCITRMRTFLLGRNIILRTDHCPLCYIMEKTVKNARVDRITHLLQEYNIDKIIHISGRENCLPDFLSRYSNDENDEIFEVDYGLTSKEIDNSTNEHSSNSSSSNSSQNPKKTTAVAAMVLRSHTKKKPLVTTDISYEEEQSSSSRAVKKKFSFNRFDLTKLLIEQDNDPIIQNVRKEIHNQKSFPSFVLKKNILYKLVKLSKNAKKKIEVIYLPSSMVKSLLEACHDDPLTGAHFSFDRTYNKIKSLYWWPDMKSSIKAHIAACLPCKQYNISRHKPHGHLRPITPPDGPLQLIGIDYCGPLIRTPRENQYVLVITDYFSRHVTAIALPDCSASTTAQALFNDFFCKYGIPSGILSDQGSHFRNQLMENIALLIGYNHIFSTPYHPQTNGIVERFNATFIPQIAKLQDTQHNNWDEYLQAVVFAYNTGIHKSTNYSPFELLYGRSSQLPIHPPPQHFSFSKPIDYFNQLR